MTAFVLHFVVGKWKSEAWRNHEHIASDLGCIRCEISLKVLQGEGDL